MIELEAPPARIALTYPVSNSAICYRRSSSVSLVACGAAPPLLLLSTLSGTACSVLCVMSRACVHAYPSFCNAPLLAASGGTCFQFQVLLCAYGL